MRQFYSFRRIICQCDAVVALSVFCLKYFLFFGFSAIIIAKNLLAMVFERFIQAKNLFSPRKSPVRKPLKDLYFASF